MHAGADKYLLQCGIHTTYLYGLGAGLTHGPYAYSGITTENNYEVLLAHWLTRVAIDLAVTN